MGFFSRRSKDVEVTTPDEHFSVSRQEPMVAFEIVEDEPAPAAPVDPHARWRPATPLGAPAAPPPFPAPPTRAPPQPQAPPYVTPRPVREPRVEMPPVQTEWARRAFGPLGADRVRGMCSGCGTMLSVARAPRPLRTACPVCGRTRVLS